MTITRINEFKARPGQTDELRRFLVALMPSIAAEPGCSACRLLQSEGDETCFMLVEDWSSIAAHQAALKHSPHDSFRKLADILDEPPRGEYFRAQQ